MFTDNGLLFQPGIYVFKIKSIYINTEKNNHSNIYIYIISKNYIGIKYIYIYKQMKYRDINIHIYLKKQCNTIQYT